MPEKSTEDTAAGTSPAAQVPAKFAKAYQAALQGSALPGESDDLDAKALAGFPEERHAAVNRLSGDLHKNYSYLGVYRKRGRMSTPLSGREVTGKAAKRIRCRV